MNAAILAVQQEATMTVGKVPPWTSSSATSAASIKGAPMLRALDEEQVIPPALLDMAPLDRHLWFFKAASKLGSAPAASIDVDTKDHFLTFSDMDVGLKKVGLNAAEAALLAVGVLVDRGGRQLLKGGGGFGKMDISPGALWGTAHESVARSGVYDAHGNVDETKEAAFLAQLDPQGRDRITMDDFKRAGAAIIGAREPGGGLLQKAERWKDEGTFDRAWHSFMNIAGHTDPSTGTKFVTRDDIRWFFDGSYFFRLAQAKANS